MLRNLGWSAGGFHILRLTPPVMEALIGPPHIYPTALHVVSTSMLHRGVWRLLCLHSSGAMQDSANELPRTRLLGTPVNKGKNKGRGLGGRT